MQVELYAFIQFFDVCQIKGLEFSRVEGGAELSVEDNGIGISKAMEYINSEYNGDRVHGKDSYWTVNAAWLF